jgi:uncharacterized protein YggT (Ycf19 family)
MKLRRRKSANRYTFYSEETEPLLPPVTSPMPYYALPHESWLRRFFRNLGAFIAAIIRKINQLLALALAVLLLLLFTRFALTFFHLTLSIFASWVFMLSAPLTLPFDHLVPSLPYNGYTIDVSLLIAILVYALVVTIVRQFLKVLAGR